MWASLPIDPREVNAASIEQDDTNVRTDTDELICIR
jgi:hypothetical protein